MQLVGNGKHTEKTETTLRHHCPESREDEGTCQAAGWQVQVYLISRTASSHQALQPEASKRTLRDSRAQPGRRASHPGQTLHQEAPTTSIGVGTGRNRKASPHNRRAPWREQILAGVLEGPGQPPCLCSEASLRCAAGGIRRPPSDGAGALTAV